MKGTEKFQEVIKAYLDQRAAEDELFAAMRTAVNRPIEDIVTYILNQVNVSGCCGFSDDEIYGIAVHAAETAELEIGKPIPTCQVVINHQVQLTEEEKAEQKAQALKRYQDDELRKIQQRNTRVRAAKSQENKQAEPSLFEF